MSRHESVHTINKTDSTNFLRLLIQDMKLNFRIDQSMEHDFSEIILDC